MIASGKRTLVYNNMDEPILAAARAATEGIFMTLQLALRKNPPRLVPLVPRQRLINALRNDRGLIYKSNEATAIYFKGLPEANCELSSIDVATGDAGWFGHVFPKRRKLNWKLIQGQMMVQSVLRDRWIEETKKNSVRCRSNLEVRGISFNYYRNIIILCGSVLLLSIIICFFETWVGRDIEELTYFLLCFLSGQHR